MEAITDVRMFNTSSSTVLKKKSMMGWQTVSHTDYVYSCIPLVDHLFDACLTLPNIVWPGQCRGKSTLDKAWTILRHSSDVDQVESSDSLSTLGECCEGPV